MPHHYYHLSSFLFILATRFLCTVIFLISNSRTGYRSSSVLNKYNTVINSQTNKDFQDDKISPIESKQQIRDFLNRIEYESTQKNDFGLLVLRQFERVFFLSLYGRVRKFQYSRIIRVYSSRVCNTR